MNKFLLIPDSFKGTMSSEVICAIMEKAIRRNRPDAEIVSIPVADGGEGMVDAFLRRIFSINRVAVEYKHAKMRAREDLYLTVDNLIRYMNAIE